MHSPHELQAGNVHTNIQNHDVILLVVKMGGGVAVLLVIHHTLSYCRLS